MCYEFTHIRIYGISSRSWFDKLTTNGHDAIAPLVLSLSKDERILPANSRLRTVTVGYKSVRNSILVPVVTQGVFEGTGAALHRGKSRHAPLLEFLGRFF